MPDLMIKSDCQTTVRSTFSDGRTRWILSDRVEAISESRRENLFLSISAVGVGACQGDDELDVALIVTRTKEEEDHLGSSQGLLFGYRRRSGGIPQREQGGS